MLFKCKNCNTYQTAKLNHKIFVFNKNEYCFKINDNSKLNIYMFFDEPWFVSKYNQGVLQDVLNAFDGFNIFLVSLTNCIILRSNKVSKDIKHCYFNDNNNINANREQLYKRVKDSAFVFVFGSSLYKYFGLISPLYFSAYPNKDYNFTVYPLPSWKLFKLNLEANLGRIKNIIYHQLVDSNGNNVPQFEIVEVKSISDFPDLYSAEKLVLDVETNSLNIYSNNFTIDLVSIMNPDVTPYKVYLFKKDVVELLKELNIFNKLLIGYNIKFDIQAIAKYLNLNISQNLKYEDVLYTIYLLDENRFLSAKGKSLKDMVALELENSPRYNNPIPNIIKTQKALKRVENRLLQYDTISLTPRQRKQYEKYEKQKEELQKELSELYKEMKLYNCLDTFYTFMLWNKLKKKNVSDYVSFIKIKNFMHKTGRFLMKVSENGLYIDKNRLLELDNFADNQINTLKNSLNQFVNKEIDWNSPYQISEVLKSFKNLVGLNYISPKQVSTSEEDLLKLQRLNPQYQIFFKNLLEYRFWVKQKSTYITSYMEKLDSNDLIHGEFNLTGTVTGRLSSTSPNLQQISNRGVVKKFICSRFNPGYILEVDYSQMEMRVMAMLSGDVELKKIYDQDIDIYKYTASNIYGIDYDKVTKEIRSKVKTLVLGLQYGISAYGVSRMLECSLEDAQQLIEKYFSLYQGIKKYNEYCNKFVLENGYIEYSIGRRRRFPEVLQNNLKLQKEQYYRIYREAINAPVQGTASDICLINAIYFNKKVLKGKQTKIINLIHDSIIFDVSAEEKEYIEQNLKLLEHTPRFPQFKFIVPLRTEAKWHKQYWDDNENTATA